MRIETPSSPSRSPPNSSLRLRHCTGRCQSHESQISNLLVTRKSTESLLLIVRGVLSALVSLLPLVQSRAGAASKRTCVGRGYSLVTVTRRIRRRVDFHLRSFLHSFFSYEFLFLSSHSRISDDGVCARRRRRFPRDLTGVRIPSLSLSLSLAAGGRSRSSTLLHHVQLVGPIPRAVRSSPAAIQRLDALGTTARVYRTEQEAAILPSALSLAVLASNQSSARNQRHVQSHDPSGQHTRYGAERFTKAAHRHRSLLGILACLLSDPLDKILTTLILYLPLLSLKITNDKLLEAYRDVLIYIDSNLVKPSSFAFDERQLELFCQQIRFFVQIHPDLQKFLVQCPRLAAATGNADEVRSTE